MLKYLLAWFPMLLLAVGNGALRDLVYKKYTGELAAHQLSTILLLMLFAVYTGLIIHKFLPASTTQAFLIGILWMLLTLIFEFGFGRIRGRSWSALLADYNILSGRIWVLIPIWLAMAPYILQVNLKKYFKASCTIVH